MSASQLAREWLDQRQAQPKRQRNAVTAHAHEKEVIDKAIDEAPGIETLVDEWSSIAINPDAIAEDLGQAFYQASPQLRPDTELSAPAKVNKAITQAVLDHPDAVDLRKLTTYDRWSSLMAVQAMGEEVKKVLTEVQEKAGQDAQNEEAANDAASDLEQQLTDGGTDQAIQDALDAAQAAAEAAANLQMSPQDAYGIAVNAVSGAVEKAKEDLENAQAAATMWGHEPGELKAMPVEARDQLMKHMRGNRMARFAKLIGRFKLSAQAEQARKVEYGRHEPFTVTMGNQLDEVIGSELVKMAHPSLRLDFMRRLGEHQLIQRKWRGQQKAGKGPMVVLIDCSGSMEWDAYGRETTTGITRESWAKAVALALADVAGKDKRAFTAILFSNKDQVASVEVPFTAGPDRKAALMQIGDLFFGGGTKWETPLTLAMEKIKTAPEGLSRCDVVMITDGDCKTQPQFTAQWNAFREQTSVRCYGINVASGVSPGLKAISDNVRSVGDLLDPTTLQDVYQEI